MRGRPCTFDRLAVVIATTTCDLRGHTTCQATGPALLVRWWRAKTLDSCKSPILSPSTPRGVYDHLPLPGSPLTPSLRPSASAQLTRMSFGNWAMTPLDLLASRHNRMDVSGASDVPLVLADVPSSVVDRDFTRTTFLDSRQTDMVICWVA